MNKLNKKNILRFLSKINLNGMANKVLINNDSKKSFVNALDDGGNLMINCSIKGNLFDKGEEVGIYDVQAFMRYMNLFDNDELTYKFDKNSSKVNSRLLITDKVKNLSYNLADKSNIPTTELKEEPKVNYEFSLTIDDIPDILRSVEISSSKFISFIKSKGNLFLCIGDENSGEHIIKIKLNNINTIKECIVEKITFNKDYFVNILKLNQEIDFKLMDGLLIYESEEGEISVKYYQRSLIEN